MSGALMEMQGEIISSNELESDNYERKITRRLDNKTDANLKQPPI